MWFSCDITYNSPEISIKCRHLNHSTSISVGFFQTHYRLQSASPWWHTGRRKRWRRETLRFGFLFPMGSMGTICIFTYMEWLICHGQLQVVEKFTSPIDPIWVWEMVHFMIGRILMVNDMLRSFLLVFFFFGGGDGYRFAICYLRYVEWYIYIYMFFFPTFWSERYEQYYALRSRPAVWMPGWPARDLVNGWRLTSARYLEQVDPNTLIRKDLFLKFKMRRWRLVGVAVAAVQRQQLRLPKYTKIIAGCFVGLAASHGKVCMGYG